MSDTDREWQEMSGHEFVVALRRSKVCGVCNGHGHVTINTDSPNPQTEISGRCSSCKGTGREAVKS